MTLFHSLLEEVDEMAATTPTTGSALRHGPLWGARAADWALNEEQQTPTYEEVTRRLGLRDGHRVLEVGCGTGVFLRMAADRGVAVSGIDASRELVAIARERVPEADVRVGEMQALPHADNEFDAVLGFNAFFFAADMVEALREAVRVTKPGGQVAIQVWGRPERCDLTAMKHAVASVAPVHPDGDEPAPPALWEDGVLEGVASAAGLTPREAFDISWSFWFPDYETLARAMVSPGLVVELLQIVEEATVRAAILEALAPYRLADGGYALRNEWHTLIATT
jgi:SAM-dependent methyltransferase